MIVVGTEQCKGCKVEFKAQGPADWEKYQTWYLSCPRCGWGDTYENNPKIVWRLDEYSKNWYTTLVHRFTPLDEKTLRFEYFDV